MKSNSNLKRNFTMVLLSFIMVIFTSCASNKDASDEAGGVKLN